MSIESFWGDLPEVYVKACTKLEFYLDDKLAEGELDRLRVERAKIDEQIKTLEKSLSNGGRVQVLKAHAQYRRRPLNVWTRTWLSVYWQWNSV
jgi:hypothetical protein